MSYLCFRKCRTTKISEGQKDNQSKETDIDNPMVISAKENVENHDPDWMKAIKSEIRDGQQVILKTLMNHTGIKNKVCRNRFSLIDMRSCYLCISDPYCA